MEICEVEIDQASRRGPRKKRDSSIRGGQLQDLSRQRFQEK